VRILCTSDGEVDDIGRLAFEAIVYATTVKPLSLFHRLTVSKGLLPLAAELQTRVAKWSPQVCGFAWKQSLEGMRM
jgi:hypothetical protein